MAHMGGVRAMPLSYAIAACARSSAAIGGAARRRLQTGVAMSARHGTSERGLGQRLCIVTDMVFFVARLAAREYSRRGWQETTVAKATALSMLIESHFERYSVSDLYSQRARV